MINELKLGRRRDATCRPRTKDQIWMWQMSFFHTILLKSCILSLYRIRDGMWLRKSTRKGDNDDGIWRFLSGSPWRIKRGVRRLWISMSQGMSLFEWSLRTVYDLRPGLWPVVQLGLPLDHRDVKDLTGSSSEKQPNKLVLYYYWEPSLDSVISTFFLQLSLEYEITNLVSKCYGPYWHECDRHTIPEKWREVETGGLFWHWHHFQAGMRLEATVQAQQTMMRQSYAWKKALILVQCTDVANHMSLNEGRVCIAFCVSQTDFSLCLSGASIPKA